MQLKQLHQKAVSKICTDALMYQHVIILVPTAPRNLMLTLSDISGNTFSITLTWSRPDPPNGLITQYNVSDTTYSYCA